ncbi:hypothetical protein GCM10010358_77670 [Streptomyces minutiscleroticus]|uniref:HTH araC/xylS-type domain-containing protein n=1 Tax=Streptomyces minutiscleroticus TaxID=68238 RepID=A0A918P1J9_9ACTN|nr:helix-turn-helix domain-containing protein [Streptomyces minutiscleroticus]GGY13906.1 hypothetical protein GCM10010358_77670 [Streptomyces minutiscleroticus]
MDESSGLDPDAWPFELRAADPAALHLRSRALRLGAVEVLDLSCTTVRVARDVRRIRRCDPELYHVCLPVQGSVGSSWVDRDGRVDPGGMLVHGTSSPCAFTYVQPDDGRPYRGLAVAVPRSLVTLPADPINRHLLGRRATARNGVGVLLAQFLTGLADGIGTDSYRPADGPRLGAVLVDLVSAFFAQLLDDRSASAALEPESRRRTLAASVRSFIQRNLTDPDLSPATVAAAHHISLSYLHRLFQEREQKPAPVREAGPGPVSEHGPAREPAAITVAALIRRQRLERARRDLADPALRGRPIHDIAARWCFSDAATFSRAFRSAYGLPPRDYRHHALGAG